MNIGRVLKYLITGVVVGAILFFAGFGVVNLLTKDSAEIVAVPQPTIIPDTTADTTTDTATVEVIPPSINVSEGTSSSPIKIKPLGAADDSATTAEGEAADATPTLAFGTLTLNAINSTNKQPLKADFLIQNDAGAAIAQVKSTEQTTLSFPVGSYKITVNQGKNKIVRYLGVKNGQNGSETFEIDAPVIAGDNAVAVAPIVSERPNVSANTNTAVIVDEPAAPVVKSQTSATVTKVPAKATNNASATTTQTPTAATETPAATSTTANSTATAPSAETEQTASTTETTTPTTASEAADQGIGGLRVSALTKVGNRPMPASFYIQRLNGENVANIKNVNTHQFNLPAGSYRITARSGTVRMVKQIKVVAARGIHEIFNMPSLGNSTTTAPTSTASVATAPKAAPAVVAPTPVAPTPSADATGRLELFARDESTNKPIRSNFYIHTPAGKLITSKTYVESIGYKLPTAQYKVTVRATGYKNKIITLNVRKDQTRRETFKMELVAPVMPPAPVAPPVNRVTAPVTAVPPAQALRQAPRPNRGGLQVNVVSKEGVPLKADIMVLRRNGTPVKRAINASTANFDLNPRNFVVRVRHGGFVTNQQINVIAGKLAIKTITFDLNTGFR
ncbi:hypothetical protein [Leucothrix arctica]|uniref:PEGA domain-containing protein n=1 Tax=Leucothrix arctica TaxID=1481894 RepID=A0A317C516_9GAMM|nr:hypothetical protein [Leucothrix arctica]PWQ93694.1 hypothetical protein DKT75_18965 [Leucothrix arctica]